VINNSWPVRSSGVTTKLLRSPVEAVHTELGATMGEFGGWRMPIQYPTGVVAEHNAVRTTVGIFDVSHLGKISVTGPGAAEFVNRCLSNDLNRIGPGQAQYTLCCNDDGGVVDDLIAYLDAADSVLLVPNAANSREVFRLLATAAPLEIVLANRHTELAMLAVQGPASPGLLAALGVPAELDYMSNTITEVASSRFGARRCSVRVCRTGYTGERGYELLVNSGDAEAVFSLLVNEARQLGGLPVGLGARDTLRTEMGYPLHGQDLSPRISPVQAGASWAVGWNKPEFFGREALLAEREAGPRRRLWGLRATGRGVPRPHMPVMAEDRKVGETTSGTFSPTLKTGIALALLDTGAGLAPGAMVAVAVRGRPLPCQVVKPPFVESHVRG
jgi:aminomethyltransferase